MHFFFIGRRVLRKVVPVILPAVLMIYWSGCLHRSEPRQAALIYPVTATTNQSDVYHGIRVEDPYRWLEDDHSEQTKKWVEAQNKLTFGYLGEIKERARIKQRLTELWNYERYGVPFREGSRYFFTKNNGLQNHSVLYTMPSLDAAPTVLLDPNTFSADGTVSLAGYSVSDDGKWIAYGTSSGGSDWQDWKIRDIETGRDREDLINWVKFSGAAWRKDGSGFFYSRYDQPATNQNLKGLNVFHKLYFHRMGTAQAEDELVYHRPDQKEWGFGAGVTEDGDFLVIHIWKGTETKNRVFYKTLSQGGGPIVELLNQFDASYDFISNDGPIFYFRTDLDAPRGRIIAIDTRRPERSQWREIIPQSAARLQGANHVGGKLIAFYLKDAHSEVRLFETNGQAAGEVSLPGLGSVGGFGGKKDETDTFYSFSSFTTPGTIYRYDLKSGRSEVFRQPKVAFDSKEYETKQIFYSSRDGTRVPMFITHRKGLVLDGNNPTYLYGYGGFDISLTPGFSVGNLVWMEMGGVYAMANLRGGGEYGEEWHQAGMKLKKQNVFDDFIAAAEWLAANRYTRPARLGIGGGSNGGLLVGACLTQRPELFGAAIPAVGVMDMLRFHKFTIGWAWTSDYGSSDDAEEFKALHRYSPLHNIRAGTGYPATLITTADHDDRVVPAHSFKFAATLQKAQAGRDPILIRIETRAGHGAGKSTEKQIEETADRWAFLVRELEMRPIIR